MATSPASLSLFDMEACLSADATQQQASLLTALLNSTAAATTSMGTSSAATSIFSGSESPFWPTLGVQWQHLPLFPMGSVASGLASPVSDAADTVSDCEDGDSLHSRSLSLSPPTGHQADGVEDGEEASEPSRVRAKPGRKRKGEERDPAEQARVRTLRNRAAAQASRERKRRYVTDIEEANKRLRTENDRLARQVAATEKAQQLLQTQVALLSQQMADFMQAALAPATTTATQLPSPASTVAPMLMTTSTANAPFNIGTNLLLTAPFPMSSAAAVRAANSLGEPEVFTILSVPVTDDSQKRRLFATRLARPPPRILSRPVPRMMPITATTTTSTIKTASANCCVSSSLTRPLPAAEKKVPPTHHRPSLNLLEQRSEQLQWLGWLLHWCWCYSAAVASTVVAMSSSSMAAQQSGMAAWPQLLRERPAMYTVATDTAVYASQPLPARLTCLFTARSDPVQSDDLCLSRIAAVCV